MENLKDFTKAEFLSFLYAEKSREIENNSVPGWSKWALLGTMFTIVLFIYQAIITYYSEYNIHIISSYLIVALAIILQILHYTSINSNVRTFISGKIRPLIEEAPVLSYVFQLIICIIGSIIQFHWIGKSTVFWNLIIALAFDLFILVYVVVKRNRYVNARLKTQTFIKEKTDCIVRFFLGWAYMNIICFSLLYIVKETNKFYSYEFELVVGFSLLILLLYWILKIKYKNNSIAEGLDRLIDRFVIGSISQEEAYRQYVLMIYGFSAFQTVKDELDIIEKIKSDYDEKINNIENLKSQVQNKTISFDNLERIQKTLENEISYYSKSLTLLSKLLDKIDEISKLGIPAVVDKEFMAFVDDYKNAYSLFSNLITQTESIIQEIKQKIFCKKYGGYCLNTECSQRNDPISLKYKLHRKVKFIFKSIQRRINFNRQK